MRLWRVPADQLRQHGRRREHGGDLAAREQLVRIGHIDAADQLDRRAAFEPCRGEQRRAMRVRGHQQHAVVLARHERQMRAQQHVRVPAAVMAMDDRLRAAGGARRHDHLAPGARIERRRSTRPGRARHDVFQHHHVEPEPGDARQLAALHDGAAHAHDAHRIGDVVRSEVEIDDEFRRAARHHAVARRDDARPVARYDRDRFAGLRARRDHGVANRARLPRKLRIGQRAPARRDRDARAE